jgi:hypothetical protein
LATFRDRFPSRRDVLLVFAACAFPVHVWAIISMLWEFPAWILILTPWNMAGVIAYTLAFALLESLTILFGLLVLAIVLPGRWFRDSFVALSTMAVFVTTGWAILAHYNDVALQTWSIKSFLLWAGVYLVSLGFSYALVQRFTKLGKLMVSLADRLLILAYLYLSLDVLSVAVIAVRNVGGIT